jgi:hypothetical protein
VRKREGFWCLENILDWSVISYRGDLMLNPRLLRTTLRNYLNLGEMKKG